MAPSSIDRAAPNAPVPYRLGEFEIEGYQARIGGSIGAALEAGATGVVQAPTGSGKSVLIADTVSKALDRGIRPVVLLHPTVELLTQNVTALARAGVLGADVRVATWTATTDRIVLPDGTKAAHRTFDADVILATSASLVRNVEAVIPEIKRLGPSARLLYDEGQGAGADRTSEVVGAFADGKTPAVMFSATPFRPDGIDILAPYGKATAGSIIDHADHDEVCAAGRIVPPSFTLARAKLAERVGYAAIAEMEQRFEDLVRKNKSIDQASVETYSRLFRADADAHDQKIAAALVKGQADLWRDQVAETGANLSVWHCDGQQHSFAMAKHLSTLTMPTGHPRAGKPIRVAYITGDQVGIAENGALQPFDAKKSRARAAFMEGANQGDYDAIVNCGVIAVGTDIPRADMTVFAVQQRCMNSAIQSAGRTARAYTDPATKIVKTGHRVLDFGTTVESLYRDVEALRRGEPVKARADMRALPPVAWVNLAQMFDSDPTLAQQFALTEREIQTGLARQAAAAGAPAPRTLDEADKDLRATLRDAKIRAEAQKIQDHVTVLGSVMGVTTYGAVAPFVDKRTGAKDAHHVAIMDVSRAAQRQAYLVVVNKRSAPEAGHAFLARSMNEACCFVAYLGVKPKVVGRLSMDVTGADRDRFKKLVASLPPGAEPSPRALHNEQLYSKIVPVYAGVRALEVVARRGLASALHEEGLRWEQPTSLFAHKLTGFDEMRLSTLRVYVKKAGIRHFGVAIPEDAALAGRLFDGMPVKVIDMNAVQDPQNRQRIIENVKAGKYPVLGPKGAGEDDLVRFLSAVGDEGKPTPRAPVEVTAMAPAR